MIKFLIFLSAIVYANSASVKREEYNPDPITNVASNNSPVYNPTQGSPSGYSSYSSNYANPSAISNQNSNNVALNYAANQPAVDSNQAYVDNVAASSNIQSTQPNQQSYSNLNQGGNLFYYYFPVQDKNKEINYQASPSNQYTSSIVQPQQNDEQSNQNNNNNNSPQNSGHDLNYGAQDLAYTASAINENNNAQQAANNNYDSQLTNLASALNQYNFGSGSGNGFSNSQFASQLNGLNNLGGLTQGFGEAFSGSIPQPNSVPFVNDPAFTAAMANQLGNFQSQSTSNSGGSGGPFSQLYQQATQVYQGLLNSATGGQSSNQQPQFAASQQHSSYEASTGGSGFRSKYGLSTIMMPLIALAGLSLLIPTVTSLSTVASRKKRSAEDNLDLQQIGLGSYAERIDRYYSLYKNAIEKEDCMNRIICEIGSQLSSVRGKDQLFEFVERVMPNSWNSKGSKVSILKTSALSNSDNAKCKKYRCH